MYDPNCKICHQPHPANTPHVWPNGSEVVHAQFPDALYRDGLPLPEGTVIPPKPETPQESAARRLLADRVSKVIDRSMTRPEVPDILERIAASEPPPCPVCLAREQAAKDRMAKARASR